MGIFIGKGDHPSALDLDTWFAFIFIMVDHLRSMVTFYTGDGAIDMDLVGLHV